MKYTRRPDMEKLKGLPPVYIPNEQNITRILQEKSDELTGRKNKMPKFERVKDKWKHLRDGLYGNVEPEVTLEAVTLPIGRIKEPNDRHERPVAFLKDMEYNIRWKLVEALPAIAAGVSYGNKGKFAEDHEAAIKLNKKLIKMGHLTPLESIQLNFFVSGISKACGAQISRHRVGQGHVSASRRFQTAGAGFIYPALDYIEDEAIAKKTLEMMTEVHEQAYREYELLREGRLHGRHLYSGSDGVPLKKEDARVVLPVSYATERSWWVNVRALRDFFRLRLAADSEWEIRRLAWMMYDLVSGLLPSLFEDLMDGQKMPYSMFPEEPYDPDNEENTGWVPTPETINKLRKLRYGDEAIPHNWNRELYNESKIVTRNSSSDFYSRMRGLLSRH